MRPTECDYEGCVRWIALALLGPKRQILLASVCEENMWLIRSGINAMQLMGSVSVLILCSTFQFDLDSTRPVTVSFAKAQRSLATRLATIVQRNWCVYFVVFCCPKCLTGSWPTAEKHSLTNTLMQLALLTLNGFASLFCCLSFSPLILAFCSHSTFYPKGLPHCYTSFFFKFSY